MIWQAFRKSCRQAGQDEGSKQDQSPHFCTASQTNASASYFGGLSTMKNMKVRKSGSASFSIGILQHPLPVEYKGLQ